MVLRMVRFFGAAAIVLRASEIVYACSVCVSGASDPTAEAFNASVLFLMTTPYLVVGSIAGALFFIYRRATKRDREESADGMMQLAMNEEESGR